MNYAKNLQQDPIFSKHCSTQLPEYKDSFDLSVSVPNYLLASAAVICDNQIDHALDGYSWAILARIIDGKVDIKTFKIHKDEILRLKETNEDNKIFGLFNGKIPFWKKLFLGRIPQLLWDGRAIQRETIHQPIYYPNLNQLSFASLNHWPTFNINWKGDLNPREIYSYIRSKIPSSHYLCTHPHYDYNKDQVLTYSFLHSKFSRKTTIWFYSFGKKGMSNPVKYTVNDRLILHMFGFTENYFVIFATPLILKSKGQCSLNYGTPILRVIDDNFCGDLILHFIPRYKNHLLTSEPFSINTRHQGFVYHSINCFETENKIIVDAFVSKLNPSREASQFELSSDKPVFDNEGDPFRFVVKIDDKTENKTILSKLISTNLDSSIDFHTINPLEYGKNYKNWYMVSYDRQRDYDGNIISVVSKLNAFTIDTGIDSLDFDNDKTLKYQINSKSWSSSSVVYLRTPIYIPSNNLDTDRLVCWSYEEKEGELLAYLLFFNVKLELLEKIAMNQKIPYSIHSWGISKFDNY